MINISMTSVYSRQQFYEDVTQVDYDAHIERAVSIRAFLREFNSHFRDVEDKYRCAEEKRGILMSRKWNCSSDHAMFTHQD